MVAAGTAGAFESRGIQVKYAAAGVSFDGSAGVDVEQPAAVKQTAITIAARLLRDRAEPARHVAMATV
jgi:hypothetical protein